MSLLVTFDYCYCISAIIIVFYDNNNYIMGVDGTCLFGRLKICVFKWKGKEVLFFKCEEMKKG